ncbi:PREDICTED: threonine--tRNA ligase, cytoplasmic-like [Branchiostoma belcheri]|nr:PREDICTED: threonine--tRNA ligase, cytoplasmic-like [Branchiostoma belcheri]
MCEADCDPGDTMNKKIRNAQLAQYNFIMVVGKKEVESGTVNVRTRDNKVHGERSVEDVILRFRKLQNERVKNSEETFEDN